MNVLTLRTAMVTMTSREIADLTEKRHDNVKRTIDDLRFRELVHPQSEDEQFEDALGRTRSELVYRVNKRDSYVIVAQLSPEFTARLVDRWQELEAGLAPQIPQTMAQALRLAAEQAEQIEQQALQIEAAKPAVDFVSKFVQAEGLKGFREVAKLLKANEARFTEFLLDHGIMYRLAGKLTASAAHLNAGRFELRAGVADHNGHAFTTSKFTPKGIDWIAGEWAKHQLRGGEAA